MKHNIFRQAKVQPPPASLGTRLADLLRPSHLRQFTTPQILEHAEQCPTESAAWLTRHGVVVIWLDRLKEETKESVSDRPVVRICHEEIRRLAALQGLIEEAASTLLPKFDEAGIQHVVLKGITLAHQLYAYPLQRPFVDLDIFVNPSQRHQAARVLSRSGYQPVLCRETISHEATFIRGNVPVDLHWHILRPGRLRNGVAQKMLESRVRDGKTWMLGDSEALSLHLFAPAISDYLFGRLITLVDVDRWVRCRRPNWHRVGQILRNSGLKTAAWLTATAAIEWLGTPFPEDFIEQLAPSPRRRQSLLSQMKTDLPTRYVHAPLRTQVSFSLRLQDTWSGMLRAAAFRLFHAAHASAEIQELERELP